MMKNTKLLFIVLLSTVIYSCVSVEKSLVSKIRNYDYNTAKRFLADSCIVNYNLMTFNAEFNRRGLPPLKNINEVKNMIKVIPVLNVDIKALEYDYSQNFLKYIRKINSNEHSRYIGFICEDSKIILDVHAVKLKGESWREEGLRMEKPEGDPFFENLIREYPDRFFFCTALKNYCVVIKGELFVCRRELKKLQTIKEYFNSYFPLKDFKEELRYYSGED